MFAILLGALLVADTSPEPGAVPARGTAPLLLNVQVKDGKLTCKREVTVIVPVTVPMKVLVNGREQTVYRTVQKTEIRTFEMNWDLKKATAQEAGGKKIDGKTLTKLLARPRPVVMSANGSAIDPGWLKLFAKDTLVIVATEVRPPQPKDSDGKKPQPR
jgi:hypothetical protein